MGDNRSEIIILKIARGVRVSLDKELMLHITIGISWASLLLFYARGVILKLPVLKDYVDEVNVALVAIPVLLSLPTLIRKISVFDFLIYILIVSYLLSCYVFFPENSSYLDENALTCIFCIFTYYFIGRVIEIEKYNNYFLTLSTICILSCLYYYLIYMPQHTSMANVDLYDNMWVGYQALPHVAMLLWSMMERFRIWKLLVFIAGVLFLLSCGTRGPLACLGLFGILYFLFYMKFKGAAYVKTAIVVLFSIFVAFMRTIVSLLGNTFVKLSLSTRILEKFTTGELGDDTYRSILRDKINDILTNGSHFWGLGAFGCRNYNVIYPHFLPLDFACTFGYFIGYFLFSSITLLVVYAIWKTRGTRKQIFIILLFCIGFAKLFLSNTFLLEPYFYMLIGVCVKETMFPNSFGMDAVAIHDNKSIL